MTDRLATEERERRPVLAASVAVWRNDRVLLVQRRKPPLIGVWSLPGGHVEFGEPVAEAAVRELMEETGVTADLAGLIDITDVIRADDDGTVHHHFALAAYVGIYRSGEAVAGDDAGDVRWATLDELGSIELTPGTEGVIRRSKDMVNG